MKGTEDDRSEDTEFTCWQVRTIYVVSKRQEASKSFVLERIPRSTQSNFVSSKGNLHYFHLGSKVTKLYTPV